MLEKTGASVLSSSGSILLESANAGTSGVSGMISLLTGTTSIGDSGSISLRSGTASSGRSGTIELLVGLGNSGEGGSVVISSGQTDDFLGATGGFISLSSGYSTVSSSGPFFMDTPNSGSYGVSGEIVFSTGTSANGNTGSISLSTGQLFCKDNLFVVHVLYSLIQATRAVVVVETFV